MEENSVKKTAFSKYLRIARCTLDDYLDEKTYMTSEIIQKAAKYFKVPVGYFFDEVSKNGSYENIINELKTENESLKKIIANGNIRPSNIFLAVPIDDDEFLDLREMKDKVIRVLSK